MSRGHDRERAVKKHLEGEGWLVLRAAGSLGVVDLVALRPRDRPLLVEVKSTAKSPYERFGPADREALRDAATQAGAHAVLAYWPPRKRLSFIYSHEWPSTAVDKLQAA